MNIIKKAREITIKTPENTYHHERLDEFVWACYKVGGDDLFPATEYEMRKAVENALKNGYDVIME